MNILKVQNLCKKIGKKEILKDVSFEINSGDILAFIGPNGAGKTTTIKCILGLQKLNSGSVIINGYNIKNDFVKAINNVGCIVESPDVYMYLTGMQNLELQASLYHDIEEDDIAKVVALVGLEKRIYDKVSKYSLGMRQRLGIALALIHNPNLLILDEPTNGLDPEGIKELRELLKSLAKKGMGILISSHNLSELESFCNRVVILSKGEIIESSSITDIKKLDENKYILKIDDTNKVKDIIKKTDTIKDKNYIEVIREEKDIPTLINNFIKKDVLLYEIKREDISLEEAFIKKAGGKKID